jgi:hypothetical protein
MSRSTDSTSRRTLALAGVLLTAALVAPTSAQAQGITSERMLLNRIGTPAGPGQGSAPVPTDRIDGASALLGRRTTDAGWQPAPARIAPIRRPAARTDGSMALLGLASPASSRQEGNE